MTAMREGMKKAVEDSLKDLPLFGARMLSTRQILKAVDWKKENNEEAICTICQCELIEGLTQMTEDEIE